MAALSIKRIVKGSATIASGNASVSVAIGANVTSSKTRVVAKGAPGDTWSPERLYFTIELNDIGGGLSDEITFTRAGSPAVALYIEWHLIEYEAGASVTWLSYNTGASWGGTHDETISAVDLDKTLVIPSYRVANTTTGTTLHYLCRWELTSATNLRVTSKDSTLAVAAVVQIVEYDSDSGVTVQQVTQAMAGTTTENATISTVTLAHTLVFGSSETSSTNGNDIMNCGWAELTSTTNLQFRRRGTADTYTATAFVVDYGAGAAQRGYNEQSNYTSLTIDQTISAVDTDFSTAQLGGGTFAFGHVGATSTNWQIRAFVPTLTSATNLRGTRQFTNSTACGIAWQVMDWSALMAGGGPTAYEDSISLGISAGLSSAGMAAAADSVALGISSGLSLLSVVSANDAVSIGLSAGLTYGSTAAARGALTLGFDSGLATAGAAAAIDTLSLGLAAGINNSGVAAALGAISVGVGIGLSISDAAAQQYSDTLGIGVGIGITAASTAAASDGFTLTLEAGISAAGQAAAQATITIGITSDILAAAQASTFDAIQIGAALGTAIADSIGGVVPPASRTITVSAQGRAIQVQLQTRRIVV